MKKGNGFTVLENVRFLNLTDKQQNWRNNNPVLLPGEIAFISDLNRIKIGTGKKFTDTTYLTAGADRFNVEYADLPVADDAKIKPATSTGKNVEDWLQTAGDIIYPITTTTAVKRKDGTTLQSWIDNVTTNNITLTGSLRLSKNNKTLDILRTLSANVNGMDIALGGGGGTILYSGEAYDNYKELVPLNTSEALYLMSDENIKIVTNCQNPEKHVIYITSTSQITPDNAVWDLGTTNNRWKSVWANTFNGALSGNASTTTKLATARKIGLVDFDGSHDISLDQMGAFPAAGGTVTGPIIARMGSYSHWIASSGTSGYFKFARITIKAKHANQFIKMEINQRGGSSTLYINFSNVDSLEPTLNRLLLDAHTGLYPVWAKKVSASVWEFYLQKTELYDVASISLSFGNYMSEKVDITWLNESVETLPDGCQEYTKLTEYINIDGNAATATKLQTGRKIGNATFDGTSDISLAAIGVASANVIIKNISIPVAGWDTSTKIYKIANSSITINHSPDVRFAESSIEPAGKAGIIAYTEAGNLVLKAATAIPTVALTIDVAILTPV